MKKNPVVHFEMPYEDKERVAAFYSKAFGWETQMMGPEMGEYVVVTTTEMDEKTRFPKEPGRINGGFYRKPSDPRGAAPSIVIAVDDIREAMQKVKDAGGTLQGRVNPNEPDDIPSVGLYISFIDTEGNRASILQPYPMMGTSPQ